MLDKTKIDGNLAEAQDMLTCEMRYDDVRKIHQLINEARVLLHCKLKVHVVIIEQFNAEKHVDIEIDPFAFSLLCKGSLIVLDERSYIICNVKIDPKLDTVMLEVR